MRNLFLTMLLGGIWHGAAWTFIIWGAIHGFALGIERLAAGIRPGRAAALAMAEPAKGTLSAAVVPEPPAQGRWSRAVCILATFHIVCLAWIFFRAENLEFALAYLGGLTNWSADTQFLQPFLVVMVAGSLAAHFLPAGWVTGAANMLERTGPVVHGAALGFGILVIESLAPEGVAPFIYFQF